MQGLLYHAPQQRPEDLVSQPQLVQPFIGTEMVAEDAISNSGAFAASAIVALTADTEIETGTVTVTLTAVTDEVWIVARQYLYHTSLCNVLRVLQGRIRRDSLTGTVIDGPIEPEGFMTAPADKGCGSAYTARRGMVTHIAIDAPAVTGSKTYKMSGKCAAGAGSATWRGMTAFVRKR